MKPAHNIFVGFHAEDGIAVLFMEGHVHQRDVAGQFSNLVDLKFPAIDAERHADVQFVAGFFRLLCDADLCLCFCIRVIAKSAKVSALPLIVDGSAVVLKAVVLHRAVHISLGGAFCFFQRGIIQLIIKAVFKMMIGDNQIAAFRTLRYRNGYFCSRLF